MSAGRYTVTFLALVQSNFAILAEEITKRVATYQNGNPTTITGPPTSGAHVLNEFWRDALGAEFRCTQAGTPGTWLQIRSAAVTADLSSGTIPVGYWIWNTTPRLPQAARRRICVGGGPGHRPQLS